MIVIEIMFCVKLKIEENRLFYYTARQVGRKLGSLLYNQSKKSYLGQNSFLFRKDSCNESNGQTGENRVCRKE